MEIRRKYKVYQPSEIWKHYVTKLLTENPSYYYVVRETTIYSYPHKHLIDVKNTIDRKKIEAAYLKESKIKENKEQYVQIKDQINNLKNYYNNYSSKSQAIKIISRAEFISILEKYYSHAIDNLIETGEPIYLCKGMGYVYLKGIKKGVNSGLKVDWNKSNIEKQKLINQGITPQNLSKNIEGEKWIIYRDDDRYVKICWKRSPASFMKLYYLEPTRSVNGLFCRMINKLTQKPLLFNLYKNP